MIKDSTCGYLIKSASDLYQRSIENNESDTVNAHAIYILTVSALDSYMNEMIFTVSIMERSIEQLREKENKTDQDFLYLFLIDEVLAMQKNIMNLTLNEKIDWFVQKILKRADNFVPEQIENIQALIELKDELVLYKVSQKVPEKMANNKVLIRVFPFADSKDILDRVWIKLCDTKEGASWALNTAYNFVKYISHCIQLSHVLTIFQQARTLAENFQKVE